MLEMRHVVVTRKHVDLCLDAGVSWLFDWIEDYVPLPLRILTKPIEVLIRRRIKRKLRRIFNRITLFHDKDGKLRHAISLPSDRVALALMNEQQPARGDYHEADY